MSALPLLHHSILGEAVSRGEAADLLRAFARQDVGPEVLAAALTALRIRGEGVPVLLGFAEVLRENMVGVDLGGVEAMDLCGTGGDGQGTVNLSTAAAFVVAGAGVPVAKHGNHGVSSRTGSADVLGALGIPPARDPALAARALKATGLAFLYAPAHHPLFARIGPVRRSLGFPTAFNLLGPLCNPARVRRQVLGVARPEALDVLPEVLRELGHLRALVVHTPGPYDEVSLTAPAQAVLLRDGRLERLELAPEAFGARRVAPEALRGGDSAYNASRILSVLSGEPGPLADAICANAACALWVAEAADDLRGGFALAQGALRSGRALACLEGQRALQEGVGHDLAG